VTKWYQKSHILKGHLTTKIIFTSSLFKGSILLLIFCHLALLVLLGLNTSRLSSPKHMDIERRWESEVYRGNDDSKMRTVTAPKSPMNGHLGVYLYGSQNIMIKMSVMPLFNCHPSTPYGHGGITVLLYLQLFSCLTSCRLTCVHYLAAPFQGTSDGLSSLAASGSPIGYALAIAHQTVDQT
jgi:hypothetical protein